LCEYIIFFQVATPCDYWDYCDILQINALLETLDLTDSAQPEGKGHFSLYNCLVLGHTKYNGVQWVDCNPFPAKLFYGNHRLDIVMILPPVLDHRAFVVSPYSVCYALGLLLFSVARFSFICTGFAPFLNHIKNQHQVQNI
jgi:hypothetical protein